MNGKAKLTLAAAFAVLCVSATAAFLAPASLKTEANTLAGLGVTYTETGNAAETYLPYLREEKPVVKEAWFKELNLASIAAPTNDKERQAAKDAVVKARADLDVLIAASKKSGYALWGTLYTPPATNSPWMGDAVDYPAVIRLATLLIPDAQATADPKAAEEKLLAAVRIGNHFETDVTSIGFLIGNVLKKWTAIALADFYTKQGKPELADKWKKYSEHVDERMKFIRAQIKAMGGYNQEQIMQVMNDPDAPVCLKAEAIVSQHYCITSKVALAQCKVLGPPGWVKKLEADNKDPQLAVIIPLLKNEPTWEQIYNFEDIE